MGQIYQEEKEGVLRYANKVKDLAKRILEEYKLQNNNAITAEVNTAFDNAFADCFKKGLKPEIENKVTENQSLSDMIEAAIKIDKDFDAKEALRGFKNLRIGRENTSNTKGGSEDVYAIQKEDEVVTCQVCDKKSHTATHCFQQKRDQTIQAVSSNTEVKQSPKSGEIIMIPEEIKEITTQ